MKKEIEDSNASEISDYSTDIEDLFINYIVSNSDLFIRCKGILKSQYFDNKQNRDTIDFIDSYSRDFTAIPSVTQIHAMTGKTVELMQVEAAKHDGWFLREIELFCKHKALRDAILASPDLLEAGKFGEALELVKAAVQIALVKDLGTDYYMDPKARLEALRDNSGKVSTGWRDVDDKLYGGLGRGELTVFCGQSGSGKSLFLQNLAVNWAEAGLGVVYLSLELSEKLSAMRIDAMHTGYETRDIMKNIDNVHMKVRAAAMKSKGSMQIKQLPNGCTANDVRAYVKEYEIQSGIKVDTILIDYLDLMMPAGRKISAENLFVKDKYVSEELRNLAVELDVVMVSAAQLNRASYDEAEFNPSHISGGISKVNTADNVVGISTSASMREAGRYQLQFMKTRSSSGVGSSIDLAFNNRSLRIYDLDDGDDDVLKATTNSIYDQLKNKSNVRTGTPPSTKPTTVVTAPASSKVPPLQGATALRALIRRQ